VRSQYPTRRRTNGTDIVYLSPFQFVRPSSQNSLTSWCHNLSYIFIDRSFWVYLLVLFFDSTPVLKGKRSHFQKKETHNLEFDRLRIIFTGLFTLQVLMFSVGHFYIWFGFNVFGVFGLKEIIDFLLTKPIRPCNLYYINLRGTSKVHSQIWVYRYSCFTKFIN